MRRILRDADTIIGWLSGVRTLGARAQATVVESCNQMLISAATGREVAISQAIGTWEARNPAQSRIREPDNCIEANERKNPQQKDFHAQTLTQRACVDARQ